MHNFNNSFKIAVILGFGSHKFALYVNQKFIFFLFRQFYAILFYGGNMLLISHKNNATIIENADNFDLKKTFECGQCFRWNYDQDGIWRGIVNGKEISVKKENNAIIIYPCNEAEFNTFWYNYFDLERDYNAINKLFSQDKILSNAVIYGDGIRILNQDPWETLCSFIISQNNNIPRIKGIVERLCENFGEKIMSGYSFPSAETIAKLSIEDLSVIRCGFRAKYIIDAAKKVSEGYIDFDFLKKADTDTAKEKLMTIYGVGEKVADCALLFSLGHIDVCPKDVWIKRALSVLYDGRFPECANTYAGIAQQYLFYYARETKLEI